MNHGTKGFQQSHSRFLLVRVSGGAVDHLEALGAAEGDVVQGDGREVGEQSMKAVRVCPVRCALARMCLRPNRVEIMVQLK